METIIITTDEKLEEILNKVWDQREAERKETQKPLSIWQVAKKTKRAHQTIKALIDRGVIKTTADGRIPATEVDKLIKA